MFNLRVNFFKLLSINYVAGFTINSSYENNYMHRKYQKNRKFNQGFRIYSSGKSMYKHQSSQLLLLKIKVLWHISNEYSRRKNQIYLSKQVQQTIKTEQ